LGFRGVVDCVGESKCGRCPESRRYTIRRFDPLAKIIVMNGEVRENRGEKH